MDASCIYKNNSPFFFKEGNKMSKKTNSGYWFVSYKLDIFGNNPEKRTFLYSANSKKEAIEKFKKEHSVSVFLGFITDLNAVECPF